MASSTPGQSSQSEVVGYGRKVLEAFKERFGSAPTVLAYAPGRVEVLGNHTDYNQGYVLSAAINLGTYFFAAPRQDETVVMKSLNMKDAETSFALSAIVKNSTWSDYVKGILQQLRQRGFAKTGFNACIGSDLPLGAGVHSLLLQERSASDPHLQLSSSAALEVSSIMAFTALYALPPADFPKLELAKICQRSENEFVGLKCGLLDQFSSLHGKANSLVLSDFRTLSVQSLPLGSDLCFLLCNTHVAHALVGSEYNERADSCAKAAQFFASKMPQRKVTHLRDVSLHEWNLHSTDMDARLKGRAGHIVGENDRVLKAAELLPQGKLAEFGELMYASHDSSRHQFENSCPELDDVVHIAKKIGVLGARLSGGGFGGSAVLLVRRGQAEEVAAQLAEEYTKKRGKKCTVSLITPSDGARLLHL